MIVIIVVHYKIAVRQSNFAHIVNLVLWQCSNMFHVKHFSGAWCCDHD